MDTKERVKSYVGEWKGKGYPEDIPDEVPHELMARGLAPSYKAVALCLLSNDLWLSGLGFSRPSSKYYGEIKRREILGRKQPNTKEDEM